MVRESLGSFRRNLAHCTALQHSAQRRANTNGVWYTIAMHELSIAHNLVELAEEAARSAGAVRVTVVCLRLGEMAGVVEDALRFCFPVAASGTLVEGAELHIEYAPVQVFCEACKQAQTLTPPFVFRCPVCGASTPRLLQGREIQIESIEIEEGELETTNS